MAFADLKFKRHDSGPNIDAVLSSSTGVVILTGATVKFYVEDSAGTAVVDETSTGSRVSIVAATCGAVRYVPSSSMTTSSFRGKAEWQVTFSASTVMTFPNDGHTTIIVHGDLDDV